MHEKLDPPAPTLAEINSPLHDRIRLPAAHSLKLGLADWSYVLRISDAYIDSLAYRAPFGRIERRARLAARGVKQGLWRVRTVRWRGSSRWA